MVAGKNQQGFNCFRMLHEMYPDDMVYKLGLAYYYLLNDSVNQLELLLKNDIKAHEKYLKKSEHGKYSVQSEFYSLMSNRMKKVLRDHYYN